MAAPQLAIRRLRLTVECPPGPAERAAREAAELLGAGLSERLAARLPEAAPEDQPVLLIRRLAVELTHSTAAPLDALAERLAEAIAAGVARAEAARASVLFFPSRAAYTAAFLEAMLDGSAWSRWWFGGFSGLRSLPASAALRTLLSRDWASAPAVLAACPPPLRLRLWAVLAPQDAEIILGALAVGPAGAPTPEAWTAAAGTLLDGEDLPDAVAALALVTEVAGMAGGASIGWLVPIAERAAALRPLLRGGFAPPEIAAEHKAGGDAAALPQQRALSGLPAPLVEAVRQVHAASRAEPGAAPAGHWRASPLLGFALLLPALHELPIDAAVRDWPAPGPALSAADLVRLLLLSACAGAEAGLWRDPLWRDLHGLPGPFGAAEIAGWARLVPPSAWRSLAEPVATEDAPPPLALPRTQIGGRAARSALGAIAARLMLGLARRLPGFAGASPVFLRANILGAGGSALIGREQVRIRLNRPPLDILLGMTGLAEREARLAEGRILSLERMP